MKQFEDLDYYVTECGLVFSGKRKRFLKKNICMHGYVFINIQIKGKHKKMKLHRIVAKTFIPNPENKPQVNHKNGIKTDNRVENLEWVTAGENQKHAFKLGLKKSIFGDKHHNSRKVINKETGEIFNTIHLAAKSINIKHNTLNKMLLGINRNRTNMKYYDK